MAAHYDRPMATKLYVVHGSHPCATVQRALEMKGLPYRVVELPPPMHAALQRVRFGGRTVPATLESGEKLSGSRAIMRRLEELAPEPSLLPADPDERAAVGAPRSGATRSGSRWPGACCGRR